MTLVLSTPLPVPLVLGWLHECGSGEADARVYESERGSSRVSDHITVTSWPHNAFQAYSVQGSKFHPSPYDIIGETS